MGKVIAWIKNHLPTKRRLIQVYAALLYNANLKGFGSGKIYQGALKNACVPGLNCYSCPGAVGACPLGALQDSLAQSGTRAPAYIFGILILFGLLLGRMICGFLCPFGLIQELLYKIKTPKLKKSRFTRIFSYFKYVILALIIIIPILYAGIPAFCKYICPSGTLIGAIPLLIKNEDYFGMLGYLFSWKFCLLVAIIVACVFIYRFFCRFICPLGAIYGFFCRVSLLGVKLDKQKCIDCGLCIQTCKVDIRRVGDHECIQCGACVPVCPTKAISWKGSKIFLKNTTAGVAEPVPAEGGAIHALADKNAESNAAVTVVMPDVEANTPVKETSSAEQGAELSAATEPAPATEPVIAEPDSAVISEKPQGGIKAVLRDRVFIIKLAALVLALGLLIFEIVFFALDPERKSIIYKVGDRRPEFTLTALDTASDKKELNTYTISKVTVLNYWYTDCPPCKEELPYFESVYAEYGGTFDLFVVHSWSAIPTGGVQNFMNTQSDENGKRWCDYTATFVMDDKDLDTYAMFGGKATYPMTVIIDAGGYITFVKQGKCTEATLRAEIEKALK